MSNPLDEFDAPDEGELSKPLFESSASEVILNVGGQKRRFDVALDEVLLTRGGSAEIFPITPQSSIESLVAEMEKLLDGIPSLMEPEARMIVYPAARPRTDQNRRILTGRVLVETDGCVEEQVWETLGGVAGVEAAEFAENLLFVTADPPTAALALSEALRKHPHVVSAEPETSRRWEKRLQPDDTFFPQQWHLRNTGRFRLRRGVDVNVTSVWPDYRGDDVVIGIVDDGVQYDHPDLAPNMRMALGYDFFDNNSDPYPDLAFDDHGTPCAGVAAARGFNGIGVSGVAPQAGIAAIRLVVEDTVDSQDAAAMAHRNDAIHIKSNSWGPPDGEATLDGPGPLTRTALANAITGGRGGRGTIFVWAGGNGNHPRLVLRDNSNYDGFANSIHTIAVAAIDGQGRPAYYSEPGANLVLGAPSDGRRTAGIVTTDLLGRDGYNDGRLFRELPDPDYTNDHGGTSAATPAVAGIVALMLQANPILGWRDIQEILLWSSNRLRPGNPNWSINTAGFAHHPFFGAGLADAERAVAFAEDWNNLPSALTQQANFPGMPVRVPDNDRSGVELEVEFNGTIDRAEHVVLAFSADHDYRGDLEVRLTSPTGVTSILAERRFDPDPDYDGWEFMTVRHWGEDPRGVWKLHVADRFRFDEGRITNATLRVHGTTSLAERHNVDPFHAALPSLRVRTAPNIWSNRRGMARITGTATGAPDVLAIIYRVNTSPWQVANGTRRWNFNAAVPDGESTVEIRAIDTARNLGPPETVQVRRR